jgi:hypothetical protein
VFHRTKLTSVDAKMQRNTKLMPFLGDNIGILQVDVIPCCYVSTFFIVFKAIRRGVAIHPLLTF